MPALPVPAARSHRQAALAASLVLAGLCLLVLALALAPVSSHASASPTLTRGGVAFGPQTPAWRPIPPPTSALLRDVHMLSSTDGWIVGNSGTILRYNGTEWTPMTFSTTETLVDVNMLDANTGFVLGWGDSASGGNIYRWDGTALTHVFATDREPNRVSALSPTDVWVSGVGKIYHYDGVSWTTSYTDPGGRNIFSIRMLSPAEGWAVGANRLIAHYLNGTWTTIDPSPAPQTLYDNFFTAPNDGWAVGFTSTTYIMHYNGTSWYQRYSLSFPLDRLYMLSATEGWATSFSSGNLGYYNGTTWTEVTNPLGTALLSLFMVSSTDGWAVGDAGTILRYSDDSTPTPVATSTRTPAPPTTTRSATPTSIAGTPTACPVQFTDVPPSNTFYPFVRCLACQGIIGGYPCGGAGEPCNSTNDPYFRPNNNITRGQIAKIVSESAGFTEPAGNQIYEDVPSASPFYLWINRLSNRGVMGGYLCGVDPNEPCGPENRPYFRPNANATRGQLAKIVSEAAGFDEQHTSQTFEDVPATNTFYIWVERLVSRQIMGGYPCGGSGEPCNPPANRPYFRWGNTVTRGQASKIVANTFFPGCSASGR